MLVTVQRRALSATNVVASLMRRLCRGAASGHGRQAIEAPGETVVRRNVHGGEVWTAIPARLLANGPSGPVMAHWPGVTWQVIDSYAASIGDPDPDGRYRVLADLAVGRWELEELVWHRRSVVTVMLPDEWFSVSAWFAADGHRFLYWYVNFETPFRRSAVDFDTKDLIIDLVVGADGEPRWKDEDEYAHARRVGFITDEQDRHLAGARDRALAMVEQWAGPFADGWDTWSPDPSWSNPTLPAGWDVVAS
jgi:hypothetical protein